jgi:DNA-binding transcriptional ArsR family regulator
MSESALEATDPADAFSALADQTRVDILRALWEADDQTATFSELRDAVGMADSGQFNYHLDKLTGRFLRKTDAGYELALAGRHVVGSLLEGAYTSAEPIEPIPFETPCQFCGGDRTFHYADEAVRIECADCAAVAQFDAAPGVFAGYDREQFPEVARRYLRVMLHQAASGFCPYCEGRFEPTVEQDHGIEVPEFEALPMTRYSCTRCEQELVADLGRALLFEPVVVSFFADHGVDIRDRPLADFVTTADDLTVRGDDPLAVAVSYTAGDAQLELVVDETLAVLDSERTA